MKYLLVTGHSRTSATKDSSKIVLLQMQRKEIGFDLKLEKPNIAYELYFQETFYQFSNTEIKR